MPPQKSHTRSTWPGSKRYRPARWRSKSVVRRVPDTGPVTMCRWGDDRGPADMRALITPTLLIEKVSCTTNGRLWVRYNLPPGLAAYECREGGAGQRDSSHGGGLPSRCQQLPWRPRGPRRAGSHRSWCARGGNTKPCTPALADARA